MDQGFACFACDHGLEFAGGESIDVACFTGHEQQDLGSRQGGEFVGLGDRKKKMSNRGRANNHARSTDTDTFTMCLK